MIHWLLEVELDGRTYRWAEVAVSVSKADGTVLSYAAGLADPGQLAQGVAAAVSVADPSVPWPALAPQLEGRASTLRRWREGTRWEAAEVYSIGEATGVSYGAPDEPVEWTIDQPPGSASLGRQVPDPAAAVSYTTWPIAGAYPAYAIGGFAAYPVVFGYPGLIAELPGRTPVMPVPIAQMPAVPAAANTYVVISEDPTAPISSVVIRNDDLDVEAAETVIAATDLLGRKILVATFALSAVPLPTSATSRLYAGFTLAGGGGDARSANDVIVYLLHRWGAESTDWSRLPEVRDALAPFLVDTWIDEPASDPWAWIESVLVPDLPIEVRTGTAGRYLVAKRYMTDPSRRVGSVTAGPDLVRTSAVTRDGSPLNEFKATFRRLISGDMLGTVLVTGSTQLASSPRAGIIPISTVAQSVTVARSAACQASIARYGLRQADPVQIGWTWDTPSVVQSLQWQAERQALPALLVSYTFQSREDLREGDELLLTDAELGWAAVPSIVDAPPVRGTTTTALLRVLA